MSNKSEISPIEKGRQILRNLSNQDFLAFGVNQIAYIKPSKVMGRPVYTLHGADGSALAVIDNFDTAVMTVRQNDMEPVTLQ